MITMKTVCNKGVGELSYGHSVQGGFLLSTSTAGLSYPGEVDVKKVAPTVVSANLADAFCGAATIPQPWPQWRRLPQPLASCAASHVPSAPSFPLDLHTRNTPTKTGARM